jgi:hypothetical protein
VWYAIEAKKNQSREADACRIVRRCLQRRSSAPRRIGVGYQLTELADPGFWLYDDPLRGDAADTVRHHYYPLIPPTWSTVARRSTDMHAEYMEHGPTL